MTGAFERAIVVAGGELTLLALLGFLTYRAWRHRDERSGAVLLRFILSVALLESWGMFMGSPTFTVGHRVLRAIAVHFSWFLFYLAVAELFSRRRRQPNFPLDSPIGLSRHPVFRITAGIVALLIVFAFLLGNNAPIFGNLNPGPRSWVFFAESALGYALVLYLDTLIVWICARDLPRLVDPVDLARRGLLGLAMGFNGLMLLYVEAGLLLPLLGGANEELTVASLYQASLLVTAALLAAAWLVPKRVLGLVFSPLAAYLRGRQASQQKLLGDLHQIVIRLAPTVHLTTVPSNESRLLVEIGDARLLIWSQEPHLEMVTPAAEARHLVALLRAHAVFDQLGEYDPPPRRELDILKHNLSVAREIRLLQTAR